MARVAVNGVALAVREWPGRGPTLVCIHGLTANHTCWESLAAVLSPDYRIVAYDLRGRGDSDKPERGYRILLGDNPLVQRALRSFLDAP